MILISAQPIRLPIFAAHLIPSFSSFHSLSLIHSIFLSPHRPFTFSNFSLSFFISHLPSNFSPSLSHCIHTRSLKWNRNAAPDDPSPGGTYSPGSGPGSSSHPSGDDHYTAMDEREEARNAFVQILPDRKSVV